MKHIINKRVLVTGANGSMAKETIKQLLKLGYVNIVMAVRDFGRGENAKQEILNEVTISRQINLSVVAGFDMNSPKRIKRAIEKLSKKSPFDIIFLAAGFAVFGENYEGIEYNGKKIEKTIFQNLIGSHIVFLELKKNNLVRKGARVVIAGGEGTRGIDGMIEKPNFNSPEELRNYIYLKDVPKYNPMNAIGVSKFVGGLWVKKISKIEFGNTEIIWFSPGLTSGSAGLKNLPIIKRLAFNIMFRVMNVLGKSQSPKKGGEKFADCLTGKIGETGQLLGAPKGKTLGVYTDQTLLNPLLNSATLKDELWNILEEITDIS